jgi:hypothetical protein
MVRAEVCRTLKGTDVVYHRFAERDLDLIEAGAPLAAATKLAAVG